MPIWPTWLHLATSCYERERKQNLGDFISVFITFLHAVRLGSKDRGLELFVFMLMDVAVCNSWTEAGLLFHHCWHILLRL